MTEKHKNFHRFLIEGSKKKLINFISNCAEDSIGDAFVLALDSFLETLVVEWGKKEATMKAVSGEDVLRHISEVHKNRHEASQQVIQDLGGRKLN